MARRIVEVGDDLGGLTRFTMQMTNAIMEPDVMLRSIELLGTEVKPRVAGLLAS